MKVFALAALALLLSGCGATPGLVVATYVIDGASYVGTGKTVSGHALSAATEKDCSVLYGLTRGQFCEEKDAEQADLERRYPDATPLQPMTEAVMLGDASTLEIDDSFANLQTVKASADLSASESVQPVKPQPVGPQAVKQMAKSETPLWTLVLGTFDNEAAARNLVKRLKPANGLVTVTVVDGKVAYRVSTMPFKISEIDDHKGQVAHLELTDIHVSRVCPAWMRDDRCVVLDRALSQQRAGLK